MSTYTFDVNEALVQACYSDEDIQNIYLPLIRQWEMLQKEKKQRIMIFVAAPPGCGKTTFVYFLEYLSKTYCSSNLQALGIDGFHYPQAYLKTHYVNLENENVCLNDIKGNPLTFDVEKLESYIQKSLTEDVRWPYYSRKLHDVVEDVVDVHSDILLLEGNYLLLDQPPWSQLKQYCSSSLFLNIGRDVLIQRLIERKMMTGKSRDEAKDFVYNSDLKNVDCILAYSTNADHTILFDQDNSVKEFK